MIIKFYGYNAFIIQTRDKKIVIDPGADLYLFKFKPLIPESEWKDVTHILVTHGDPDHHWHTDRVAKASNAPVICNTSMIKDKNGQKFMIGPRSPGLSFTSRIDNLNPVSVDKTIQIDGMRITGIRATHGPLRFKLGPLSKTLKPGGKERIGWGAIGYQVELDNKVIVNLGDTLLHEKEWRSIPPPDVLMIPIGGKNYHNTMDEKAALEAIKILKPKQVIPCHYNCPSFLSKNRNVLDSDIFKENVEKIRSECILLHRGDSMSI